MPIGHPIQTLRSAVAQKLTELRALEEQLADARDRTPLPLGVSWRRQGGDPAVSWYRLINVYVDRVRIGLIEDHSNPHGTDYAVRGLSGRTPSLNAAVWLLLEREGHGDRAPALQAFPSDGKSGGDPAAAPASCANKDCSEAVNEPGRYCGHCYDRLCFDCRRVHPSAFLLGRCETCRGHELVGHLISLARTAAPVPPPPVILPRGDN